SKLVCTGALERAVRLRRGCGIGRWARDGCGTARHASGSPSGCKNLERTLSGGVASSRPRGGRDSAPPPATFGRALRAEQRAVAASAALATRGSGVRGRRDAIPPHSFCRVWMGLMDLMDLMDGMDAGLGSGSEGARRRDAYATGGA